MERLTELDEFNNADIIGCESNLLIENLNFTQINLLTNSLNKLAEYENTELQPNEVEELKQFKIKLFEWINNAEKRTTQRESWDMLQELKLEFFSKELKE